MKRRAVRVAIVVAALALQAVAVYKLVETDHRLADARLHLAYVNDQTERIARLLAELRALQFAHVAGAQTATAEPLGALFDEVEQRVGGMRSRLASDGVQALGVSLDHLRTLREIDGRVRTFVAAGDRPMALDLALGEGLETTSNLAGQVGQARESETRATEARLGALRLIEAYFLIGALGAGLLALLLLLPAGRGPQSAALRDEAASAPGPAGTLDLRHAAPPLAAERAGRTETPAAAAQAGGSAQTAPAVDVWQLARLCTDLGQLADPGGLPAMLERAAALLGATGVIVWVVNPGDRTLRPASAHGYSREAVERIGAIDADADNATAAAFRAGELQVVHGDQSSPGALVAPMPGPAGSLGVLAAEVPAGRELDPVVQATATVLAAQFAALVQT